VSTEKEKRLGGRGFSPSTTVQTKKPTTKFIGVGGGSSRTAYTFFGSVEAPSSKGKNETGWRPGEKKEEKTYFGRKGKKGWFDSPGGKNSI